MDFLTFFQTMISSPALLITTVLTLAVILVNGWTDAPNAIATAISTRSMKPRTAIFLAAVFNLLGVVIMTKLSSAVAFTIKDMVNFDSAATDKNYPLIALCAALVAIVVWAVAAWVFGIPTSESHALIAGLSGAALALTGVDGINFSE